MKLELKHLAPYLPYGLKCKAITYNGIHEIAGVKNNGVYLPYENGLVAMELVRPFLRPLSDLTKEIEHNGERFVPSEVIGEYRQSDLRWLLVNDVNECSFKTIEYLFSLHFDVFGLIEKGLAIDSNSLAGECKEKKA